jgi:hypothetical protein
MTPSSGESEEVTVDTFQLHGCRLDQSALSRLIEAVRDPTASPQVALEAKWHGTRFRRDSLVAVRTAISRSLNPGDPRRLDQLRIEALGANRSVVVEMEEAAARVTVECVDAAWTLGRAEQIRRILRHAGGRPEPQRQRPWLWAATSGAAVACVLGLLWMLGATTSTGLGAALVSGGAATGFLIAGRAASNSQAVIWIDGPIPRRGWRAWSVGDRIALLALLVAFLAAARPLLTG